LGGRIQGNLKGGLINGGTPLKQALNWINWRERLLGLDFFQREGKG